MRTKSANRAGVPWALGVLIVLGVPAFAEAQQMGLFPLGAIQRKRTPCVNEDPIYRTIRQEYYGYYPTCWRRFPTGWGCPSPEAPDPEAAFRKLKRTTIAPGFEESGRPRQNPTSLEDDPNRADPAGPIDEAPGGRRGAPDAGKLPPLPNGGESPFDLKDNPKPKPSTAPPPAPNTSPFDINTPPAAPAVNPRLTPPADATNPKTSSRTDETPLGDTPLLALGDPTASGTVVSGDLTLPGMTDNTPPAVGNAPPARRVSLIGGLIDRVRGLRR